MADRIHPAATLLAVLTVAAPLLVGCTQRVNPSLSITHADARQAMREMHDKPVKLERPVVVLGGFLDPFFAAAVLVPTVKEVSGDDRVIGISCPFAWSFDDCRKHVIDVVDKHFPSNDPQWTTEVDVIGMSMGGVVARHAAADIDYCPRRLRINRLFTISSPHRGANLAHLPPINRLMHDMKPQSDYMAWLHADYQQAAYQLFPYVRLGDLTVGPVNAAPLGEVPWWVSNPPLQLAHGFAILDDRILADISRRLRGETPIATEPRAPLPDDETRAEDSTVPIAHASHQ